MGTGKIIGEIKREDTLRLLVKSKGYESMLEAIAVQMGHNNKLLWGNIREELNLSIEYVQAHPLCIDSQGVVRLIEEATK